MRRTGGLLLAIGLATAVGCTLLRPLSPLAVVERAAVYQPLKYPEGNWSPADLAFEDTEFAAEDGTVLHGWYIPNPRPSAIVLFAHGNGGNITHYADFLRDLRERQNVAVLGLIVLIRTFLSFSLAIEIDGVDAKAKRQFLEDLTMRDADFLVDEFDRVDCGVDTTIEIECPECFQTQEVELPFDKGFFLPGKDRTARRKARSSSSPT